jgi:hypothetical protein
MTTSPIEHRPAVARGVRVVADILNVDLVDGRSLAVPVEWYPRLASDSEAERNNWRLVGSGEGIQWPDLDEDISVDHLLRGVRSGESQASVRAWSVSRAAKALRGMDTTVAREPDRDS